MRVGEKIPVAGTIFNWDIVEILERESMDVDKYSPGSTIEEKWTRMLTRKRRDSQYEDVKTSLQRWGFVRPLTAFIAGTGEEQELRFGDGHHRLAAAIELGMAEVPVEVFKHGTVADDSGDWSIALGVDSIKNVEYC